MRGRSWLIVGAVALAPLPGWAAQAPQAGSTPRSDVPKPAAIAPTGAPTPPAATPVATPAVTRWEYRVVTYDRIAMFSDSDHDLRLMGLLGWELVAVTFDPNARTIVCFFKRPLR